MAAKTKAPAKTDWRDDALDRMRALINEADPDVVEEQKWKKPSNKMKGVPVWSHDGIICTGETYKDYIKLTFMKGASLPDPAGLFNAGFNGGTRRAIDIREGERVDARAFKALIRAAVAANGSSTKNAKPKAKQAAKRAPQPKQNSKPVLLSGGNPQIAKADGDAPVQAYLAAIPGWKRDISKRLDAIITRVVPRVRKAVKWNSPFYAVDDNGWFLSFHMFDKYVKVTFFDGASLEPLPPDASKMKTVRYYNIREDQLDEKQFASWVKQAAALPGWKT